MKGHQNLLSVLLRLATDLFFKFICYVIVYQFYVWVKPRFCRRKAATEMSESMKKTTETDIDVDKISPDHTRDSSDKRVDLNDSNLPLKNKLKHKEKMTSFDGKGSSIREEDKVFSYMPAGRDQNVTEDDEFIAEAEKLLSSIKTRKAYCSSQKIQELHTLLQKEAKASQKTSL